MYLLDLVYPEAAELLEVEKGEMATSVYGLPVYWRVLESDDADAFHDSAAHAIQISIRYLDVGTDAIVLAYSTDGSTETTQTLVTKGDTGKWKWKHKTITSNARFDHSVYLNFEYADFALQCDSELILTNVTLRETALNTEAVWKAAEERVTATAGEAATDTTLLAGWTVNEAYFVRDTGSNSTSAGLAPDDYPFYAGATYANRATAPFRVTPAGALVATSATITGSITATSGAIGGWSIAATTLTGGNATLHSSGYLLLGTSNDIVRLDATDATYRLWVGNATAASATFRVTKAGVLTATGATISGALTATSGAIGGWTIGASTISNGSISLDSSVPALKIGSATAYLTGAGIFAGLSGGAYKFHIGNPSGNYLSWDGTNLAASGQWITGGGMNPSLQSWKTNIVFSSASATQVNWTSGTIRLNDATTYSISSGNTGAMAALTYIYLDTAVSTTVLQTTTTYSTAVGSGKILIAAAQNNTTAASVIPMGGQQPIIDGGAQIAALSIVAASIAAATITGAKIAAGTITASNITAGTITATQLSATAIDSMTITGATIRTASSGARVLENTTGLFGYSASGYVFALATGSVTWNGESLSAGEMVFGSNASGDRNLKFSSGTLAIRSGTTNIATVDSSGIQTVGALSLTSIANTTTSGTLDLDDGTAGRMAVGYIRFTSLTGALTVRGIATPSNDGQLLILANNTTQNVTIKDTGAPAAGYSKITTQSGADETSTGACTVMLIYDLSADRWRVASFKT